MSSTRSLAAAAAAVLLAIPAAQAADLPPLQAPMYHSAPSVDLSGWYLRGYIGGSNQKVDSLNNVVGAGTTVSTTFLDFDASPFYGLGAGYRLNDWLRFDVTGEYRSAANFKGAQTASFGGIILPDSYNASKSEWLFMANAYVDLGTWWCITPFVGAGVGGSRNTISNFVDTGATQAGATILSTTYGGEASKWNFAWAAYAGLAYQVTPNFTVDFSYRYLSLGDATTGPTNSFDGVTVVNGTPFQFKNLTSQDFMLGIRWTCCDAPPPPLMRKG
jgi:opacity protein-like surface antigen